MCPTSDRVSLLRFYLVVCVYGPITASVADLGLSGTFTNLAIIVLSDHFLGGSTQNKSDEHYAVYYGALSASEQELLAFSSHFAPVFYFRLPKSTTLFSQIYVRKNKNKSWNMVLEWPKSCRRLSGAPAACAR